MSTDAAVVGQYCDQVIACLSDQGRDAVQSRPRCLLAGTEMLLSSMPAVDTVEIRKDDSLSLADGVSVPPAPATGH